MKGINLSSSSNIIIIDGDLEVDINEIQDLQKNMRKTMEMLL